MRRLPPPDLPEDDPLPPETEPAWGFDPPRRRPPTAVAAARPRQPHRFEPSWYHPGLGGTQRGARLMLAITLGAGMVLSVSAALPVMVTLALGGWAMRSAWAFGAGEELERTVRRRWRWLRLVVHRRQQLPERTILWVW
ncbi:MAG TPA: hypothetical protein VJT67_10960 [Longimicrobiaceae bacterium]|nr:hypothetical protein [Longimicrobiaceae bacterium]